MCGTIGTVETPARVETRRILFVERLRRRAFLPRRSSHSVTPIRIDHERALLVVLASCLAAHLEPCRRRDVASASRLNGPVYSYRRVDNAFSFAKKRRICAW